MLELIGWVGNGLFALCLVPQAYTTYKEPTSTRSLNWLMLSMAFAGEILVLTYTWNKDGWAVLKPLIFNYTCNILVLSYIISVKIRVRDMNA